MVAQAVEQDEESLLDALFLPGVAIIDDKRILVKKKPRTKPPVSLNRKLPVPWLPKTVLEAPEPKDAPISAPLPC